MEDEDAAKPREVYPASGTQYSFYTKFRCRIERGFTPFRKRMRFRYTLENYFIGWSQHSMPSRWYKTSFEAEEAANKMLDYIENGPALRYAD